MTDSEEHYVCTLSDASIKKAQEELNEDPQNRLGAVETLRKWIKDQPHLNARTDTQFLLRFLRVSKFSQLKAREKLEWALRGKKTVPTWMNNLRVTDEIIKFLRDTKFILPLPRRDKDGQMIVLCREVTMTPVNVVRATHLEHAVRDICHRNLKNHFSPLAGGFDPAIHSKDLIINACWIVSVLLILSEETQVNGLVSLVDLSQFSLKHQTFWTLDNLYKMANVFQKGSPGRFKGFHLYNMNSFFEAIVRLCLPLLTRKFKDRIVLHGANLESVYKVIPQELLPVEYLPDDYNGPNAGTMQDIMENLIDELCDPEFQAELEHETSMEWFIDDSKKPADQQAASFRRLNID